jgi:hypothetical protein
LENDNQYNEFQSDSSASDNTANAKNTNLKTIINNKLAALNLNKAARAGKNCLVNAGDRLPRSSTWTKNLLGGHLTFGAISAPMDQSRRGVVRILEVQVHPLVIAIPRFIQLSMPLPPLKPMGQSRRGA